MSPPRNSRSMNRLLLQLSCTRLGALPQHGSGVDDRRQQPRNRRVTSAREILGLGAGRRDAGGDRLADEPHLVRWRAADTPTTLKPAPAGSRASRSGAAGPSAVNTWPVASGGTVMPLMRACACGLRTNATSCVSGSFTSATNWPRPFRWRASSLRSSDAPTPDSTAGFGLHDAAAPWARLPPPVSPASSASACAAAAMAVTMLV